jgi:hypothetical protein
LGVGSCRSCFEAGSVTSCDNGMDRHVRIYSNKRLPLYFFSDLCWSDLHRLLLNDKQDMVSINWFRDNNRAQIELKSVSRMIIASNSSGIRLCRKWDMARRMIWGKEIPRKSWMVVHFNLGMNELRMMKSHGSFCWFHASFRLGDEKSNSGIDRSNYNLAIVSINSPVNESRRALSINPRDDKVHSKQTLFYETLRWNEMGVDFAGISCQWNMVSCSLKCICIDNVSAN